MGGGERDSWIKESEIDNKIETGNQNLGFKNV